MEDSGRAEGGVCGEVDPSEDPGLDGDKSGMEDAAEEEEVAEDRLWFHSLVKSCCC